MDLKRRVAAALAGVGVVATALSGWALAQALASRADVEAYHTRDAAISEAISDLHADFFSYDGQLNMYVLVAADAKNHQLGEDTYAEAEHSKADFHDDLAAATRLAKDSQLAASLGQIAKSIGQYSIFAGQVRAAVQAGRISDATRLQTVGNLGAY